MAGTRSTGPPDQDAPLSGGGIDIRFDAGGSGGPVLVMLHGIGGNAAVWSRMLPVVERRWPGRWVAADVAMALPTGWFGVSVRRVFAFGVKIGWTADEVARMKGLATRPARVFASRPEAAEHYLRVSGPAGLVEPGTLEALAGIVEAEGGFRPAADQGIYASVGLAVGNFQRRWNSSPKVLAGSSCRWCLSWSSSGQVDLLSPTSK